MKIGIDARILKTGIGTYTRNLIQELSTSATSADSFVVFVRSLDADTLEMPDKRFTKVIADYKPYSFAEQLFFPFVLMRYSLDIIHFTTFNIPLIWWGKYIVTIHDLIHLKQSTFGSATKNFIYYIIKKVAYVFAITIVTRRTRRVVTVSEATKEDLIHILKLSPKKITVIYSASTGHYTLFGKKALANASSQLATYGIVQPYILYVSTMYPHKNHKRLINAFGLFLQTYPDVQLVLVGKVDLMSQKIREYIQQQSLERSVVMPNEHDSSGYISDEQLAIMYSHAFLYVYPSLQEGFGIPILDAQEYEIPIAASNLPVFKEVGGDAVFYFDPYNEKAIANAMEVMYGDDLTRQRCITSGIENVRRFSWQKSARETYREYKQAVGELQ